MVALCFSVMLMWLWEAALLTFTWAVILVLLGDANFDRPVGRLHDGCVDFWNQGRRQSDRICGMRYFQAMGQVNDFFLKIRKLFRS